jgi:hypothetical protein
MPHTCLAVDRHVAAPALLFDAMAATCRVAAALDSIKNHEGTMAALSLILATANTTVAQQEESHRLRPTPPMVHGSSSADKPTTSSSMRPSAATAAAAAGLAAAPPGVPTYRGFAGERWGASTGSMWRWAG